jgi:drug/metabolite transporter (DMT)-like permease
LKSIFPARAWLALAVALFLWASAFAGIRAGLRAYGPVHLAVLRFVVASAALAVYAAVVKLRLPARRDLPGFLATGIIGITFYNVALNYGELTVTAGAASLLVASTPIWTALLAVMFLHERLTLLGWAGIVVSFFGVALIASGEGQGIHLSRHALIILAAAVTSGIYMVLQKHFLGRYTALEFTAYSIWAGTLLLLPFAKGWLTAVRSAPRNGTLAVIYLGIFPAAIAYLAWAYVLSHAPASRAVSLLYMIPVLAIGIAWVWLGEVPRPMSVAGGVIALAGVVIVGIWGHRGAAGLASAGPAR